MEVSCERCKTPIIITDPKMIMKIMETIDKSLKQHLPKGDKLEKIWFICSNCKNTDVA